MRFVQNRGTLTSRIPLMMRRNCSGVLISDFSSASSSTVLEIPFSERTSLVHLLGFYTLGGLVDLFRPLLPIFFIEVEELLTKWSKRIFVSILDSVLGSVLIV